MHKIEQFKQFLLKHYRHSHPRKVLMISLVLLPIFIVAKLVVNSVEAAAPTQLSLIVLPHPDDEMQAWSMIENSTSNYKVFVYMTRGEETVSCNAGDFKSRYNSNFDEIAPTPSIPYPKWSAGCKTARMNSTVNFLNKMRETDASLPSSIKYAGTYTLSASGYKLTHCDSANQTGCIADRTVRVYNGGTFGKVLFFNLGDGDLTKEEVTWAVKKVIANRNTLTIPKSYPLYNIIGSYYHSGRYPNCSTYANNDHKAIHQALYSTDFGATGYQTAATCDTDPDRVRNKDISETSWNAAFKVEGITHKRIGWFQRYYGWLSGSLEGWPADESLTTQSTVFSRHQSFWQRF